MDQYVVIASNGWMFGPFNGAAAAVAWAKAKWPDQKQKEDDDAGWDINHLRRPD